MGAAVNADGARPLLLSSQVTARTGPCHPGGLGTRDSNNTNWSRRAAWKSDPGDGREAGSLGDHPRVEAPSIPCVQVERGRFWKRGGVSR